MRKSTGAIGATTTDVEVAKAFLDALDKDRDAVADRMDAGWRTPYCVLAGVLAMSNAALYWLIGWSLFGGHGEFTIVDECICLIVGALLATDLIGVLTHS